MSVVNDWGRSLTRLLTTRAGIPTLKWEWAGRRIDAPAPYVFEATSARGLTRIILDTKALPRLPAVGVLFWKCEERGTDDGLVLMRTDTFAELLQAHYEAVVLPRQRGAE